MEERHRSKIQEKDEQIEALEADLTALREQVQETSGNTDDLRREAEIARSEVQRAPARKPSRKSMLSTNGFANSTSRLGTAAAAARGRQVFSNAEFDRLAGKVKSQE